MNTEIKRNPKWPEGEIVGSSTYGQYTVYEIKCSEGKIHYCCESLVQPYLESLHGLIDHMVDHLEYFKAQERSRGLASAA